MDIYALNQHEVMYICLEKGDLLMQYLFIYLFVM